MAGCVLLALPWGGGACASPAEVGGKGDACYRIDDCAEGLICFEQRCRRSLRDVPGEAVMAAEAGVPTQVDAADGSSPPRDAAPGAGGAPAVDSAHPSSGGASTTPLDASPG